MMTTFAAMLCMLFLGLAVRSHAAAVHKKKNRGAGPRGLMPSNLKNAYPLVLQSTTSKRFLDGTDEGSGSQSMSLDDEDSKDGKPHKKAPSKRECSFEQKKDKVEFKCKAKTTTSEEDDDDDDESETEIKDEIKFKVEAKNDEPLLLKIDYKQEIETDFNDFEMENETKTSFAVEFERLVEYRKVMPEDEVAVAARLVGDNSTATATMDDSDDSMAYDWEEDQVVSEYLLTDWSAGFTNVQETNETATFSIGTPDGVATFVFTIAKADLGNINANKMKVDFDLNGFPWTADDTYVALVTAVESKRKIEVEYDNVEDDGDSDDEKKKKTKDVKISFEDALEDIGFTPFGSYTWVETATVWVDNTTMTNATDTNATDTNATDTSTDDDGTTISVVATSPLDDGDDTTDPDTTTITYLSFSFVGEAAQGANEIYWDPEAGIGYAGLDAESSASESFVDSISFMVFTAMAWAALLLL